MGAVHWMQVRMPPQPSPVEPHWFGAQVSGTQPGEPQTPGVPPPPQVPPSQLPH
jgi:hypothetical protein